MRTALTIAGSDSERGRRHPGGSEDVRRVRRVRRERDHRHHRPKHDRRRGGGAARRRSRHRADRSGSRRLDDPRDEDRHAGDSRDRRSGRGRDRGARAAAGRRSIRCWSRRAATRLLDNDGVQAMCTGFCRWRASSRQYPRSRSAERQAHRVDRAMREEAARRIHDMGAAAVIITGGHRTEDTPRVVDLLFDGGAFEQLSVARIQRAPYARHRLHLRIGGRRRPGARPKPDRCGGSGAAVSSPARSSMRPASATGADRSIISGSGAVRPAEGGNPRYTDRVTPRLDIGRAASTSSGSPPRWNGARAGADGAVVTFLGLVRNHNLGRSVRYLEYEAYEPLALKAFERIDAEIGERWPGARLALHHRIGRLEIGEASVAIVARVAASRRRVRGVPLCDRAREADRADLEARVLRRRRRVDRGSDGESGRRAGAGGGGAGRMRVTVRLFARLRDIAGAAELARDVAAGATIGDRVAAARRRISRARAATSDRFRRR